MNDDSELIRVGDQVFCVRKSDVEAGQLRYRERQKRAMPGKSFDEIMAVDVAKARKHRDHRGGHHGLAAAVVEHALDVLGRRREQHGFEKSAAQPGKDSTVPTLESILKDFGPVKFCKHIVDTGDSPVSERELVDALTKAASEAYPELSPPAAFAKLYVAEESVWRACAVAKNVEIASLQPLVVGGPDAMHAAVDETESSEAYAQLQRIGRQRWPSASEAQQFSRAFTDPANRELAMKAHRRPSGHPSFSGYPPASERSRVR
jgi:hypothetical protein